MDKLKTTLFVVFLAAVIIFSVTDFKFGSSYSKEDMLEGLQRLYDISQYEGVEDALGTLEAYVYSYTGDYNKIRQKDANAAFELLKDYYNASKKIAAMGEH